MTEGGDVGNRVTGQGLHALADQLRRHQRFIALHIDHDLLGRPAAFAGNLVDAVGTGDVIGRGHHHIGAECSAGCAHPLVISGDDHFTGTGANRRLVHILDQRLAGDLTQHFFRQAGRAQAGRNGDDEINHGC